MMLAKHFPMDQIHILATDIDDEVLSKAKNGLYNDKSLKNLPKEMVDQHFVEIGNHTMQISDKIKNCVEFKKHNLLLDSYPTGCHLILCRNVLIYFTEEAKDKIYAKFSESQITGGVLLVGSTEQILQPKNYKYDSFRSFFYKKV